jgi:hypothetical protein
MLKITFVSFIFGTSCLMSCSTSPKAPTQPEWTHQAARTVDGGYIVYVETAEDGNPDKAKFKAEAAALEDLANECTFIPKETRIEDRFQTKTEHMNQSFVKVGLELQVCVQASKAVDPEEIRKLANVPMTEEVKRYQDLLGKPDLDGEDGEEVADGAELEPPLNPGATGGSASPVRFYVMRERIWYAKQDVILAPPATYAPGSVAHTAYIQKVNAATTSVANYEANHAEIKNTPHPYSHYRHEITQSYNRGERGGQGLRASRPARAAGYRPSRPLSAPGKKGRRRRRQH